MLKGAFHNGVNVEAKSGHATSRQDILYNVYGKAAILKQHSSLTEDDKNIKPVCSKLFRVYSNTSHDKTPYYSHDSFPLNLHSSTIIIIIIIVYEELKIFLWLYRELFI